jgi:hypothetical protein
VNDARDFAKWVSSPKGGGVPKENLACCLSPARGAMPIHAARPIKSSIDQQLWGLVRKAREEVENLPADERVAARASSRLYVYVAGHGVMPGGGYAALLDAQAAPDRRTNLELSHYSDWFERAGVFGEVCLFADCCRNYELLARPGGPDFDEPGELGGQVFPLIGYATTVGDYAREETPSERPELPPDELRGYFSRALIDGLRGNATNEKTGYVDAETLTTYVKTQLADRLAHRPAYQRQAMEARSDPGHSMTFGPRRARRPARTAEPALRGARGRQWRRVIIHFPAGFTGDVALIAPDQSNMRWRAADGPWTVWLYDGLWQVQPASGACGAAWCADNGAFKVIGADRDVQL